MNLVLLGPPGAGKGTLAALLKDSLGLAHISTGDLLRVEMKKNSLIGQEVKGYIEQGSLVPDEVVTKMVDNYFEQNGSGQGFMLDGFPRTRAQAEDLDAILTKRNINLDVAVYLQATLPVIITRLTGRRVCRNCGALFHMVNKPPQKDGVCDSCSGELYQRADDNEETIKNRMKVYMGSTEPIISYYADQDKLESVDADKGASEVQTLLMAKLNES